MKRIVPSLAGIAIAALVFAKPSPSVRMPLEHINISVAFDLDSHNVTGAARLTLPPKGSKTAGFLLNPDFEVSEVLIGGEKVTPRKTESYRIAEVSSAYGIYGQWDSSRVALWQAEIPKSAAKKKPLVLELTYQGKLYVPPDDRQFSREKIAFEVDGTIGAEGIYLSPSAWWYPRLPDCPVTHTVAARLPEGWSFVTDGKPVGSKSGEGWVEQSWEANSVADGISLSAGPYLIQTQLPDGVTLATYFLPAEAQLADGYLTACARYLKLYQGLFGPYPFPQFAVVDNFLPSGYGMPGWTLLGSEVIRLPFIKDVSLGHEVLHNWFGNSLFVDYTQGNWCEGLTTFYADYKYKEDADSIAAKEYRMNLLRDYSAYVSLDREYPVKEFSGRSDQADRAIGYGKVMMIFFMLRQMMQQVSPDLFDQVVAETYKEYQWQPIGWDVWQRQFERRLGQNLGWFFDQWVNRAGAPKISIHNVEIAQTQGGWKAQFKVRNESGTGEPFRYILKLRVLTDAGPMDSQTFIERNDQGVGLSGVGELSAILLDPNYEVFRSIYPAEIPATLASFFGDPKGVIVVPAQGTRAQDYRKVAEGLKSKEQVIVTDAEFGEPSAGNSVWIMGAPDENRAWDRLPPNEAMLSYLPEKPARWKEEQPLSAGLTLKGEEFRSGAMGATIAMRHSQIEGKVAVYTICLLDANPVTATKKLQHYGKYSYLLFDGDTNIRKGVWEVSGDSQMVWRKGAR